MRYAITIIAYYVSDVVPTDQRYRPVFFRFYARKKSGNLQSYFDEVSAPSIPNIRSRLYVKYDSSGLKLRLEKSQRSSFRSNMNLPVLAECVGNQRSAAAGMSHPPIKDCKQYTGSIHFIAIHPD
jgi:hypothetical protein